MSNEVDEVISAIYRSSYVELRLIAEEGENRNDKHQRNKYASNLVHNALNRSTTTLGFGNHPYDLSK